MDSFLIAVEPHKMKLVRGTDARAGAMLYRDWKDGKRLRWAWDRSLSALHTCEPVAVVHPQGRLSGLWYPSAFRFYSRGTLVRGQRRGLGKSLWRYLLTSLGPREVSATIASDAGAALLKSLSSEFSNIRWFLDDDRGRL